MTKPIGLQVYSVREQLATDFIGTMRRVAEIGYGHIEAISAFKGTTIEQAAKVFRDLGLTVVAAHVPLPVGDKKQEAVDIAGVLGTRRLVSGLGPDRMDTPQKLRQACDLFNEAASNARAAGLSFAIHNHWWEMEPVGPRFRYQLLLEHLDPHVLFEVDIYWARVGGADPVQVIRELGDRAPLIHVKDGPGMKKQPHTAVGEGVVDVPAAVAAAKHAECLIVELDECATDMMQAVARSYRYLTSKNLAVGRQ